MTPDQSLLVEAITGSIGSQLEGLQHTFMSKLERQNLVINKKADAADMMRLLTNLSARVGSQLGTSTARNQHNQ